MSFLHHLLSKEIDFASAIEAVASSWWLLQALVIVHQASAYLNGRLLFSGLV